MKEIEKILLQILTELQTLRQQVDGLRHPPLRSRKIIEAMLRRRGIRELKYTPRNAITLPEASSQEVEDTFYHLMKKYSFRIFLRDLIQHITSLKPEHLCKYCSEQIARQYLNTLSQHGILRKSDPWTYTFVSGSHHNFGDTLEWFVAKVMEKEFHVPATWGNRLKNHKTGGDYDVIANVESHLVYIEVKSSPPKHIDIPEITAFMDRVNTLRPDVAIFLEDTHLRMKDKLVGMFEKEIRNRYGDQVSQNYLLQRVHREIFSINKAIFITNTKPDLISNLEICLKHFLAKGL